MTVLVRVAMVAILVTLLAACSGDAERSPEETVRGPRQDPADQSNTAVPDASTTWDYVALGDSLAVGVGADRGYVDHYAAHLREDTGARIRVVNLGVSGQTSSELLGALRNDPSMRRALGEAEFVTLNIGINDLGRAGRAYANGTCGGIDGEECLRVAVDTLGENWDAIAAELVDLGGTEDAIVRTPGLGYVPPTNDNLRPYVDGANRHIAATASENGILHTEVRVREAGMSPDGVHPNGTGYANIAQRLRQLGYGPLDQP